MDKTYCTPSQIEDMTIELIRQLQEYQVKTIHKYQVVVGIKNGGLHISQPIAQALHLPHREVHISYYDNDTVIENIDFEENYWNYILLVDDIVDKGKTVRTFIEKWGHNSQVHIASLFWKPEGKPEPNFYVKITNFWITFPWEI